MTSLRNTLPRWRGFNLAEMFVLPDDRRWLDMAPSGRGRFFEEDFCWIADWGFNFARLPLTYCYWSSPAAPKIINEAALAPIDEAIEWGHRHGVHVNLCLHHVPGFCINATPEPELGSLWQDEMARENFAYQWGFLARRYSGVSTADLTFDLVNEPKGSPEERAGHDVAIRAAVAAIRAVSPQRLIIVDGWDVGKEPNWALADLGAGQSCRGYAPAALTHFQAWWAGPQAASLTTPPTWPMRDPCGDELWDKARLREHFAPWRFALAQGIGVHCGELGCWTRTPHNVMLAWLEDVLSILKEMEVGWALWNLRGSFGVLDTGRSDAVHTDWRGHALDLRLLRLLQRF